MPSEQRGVDAGTIAFRRLLGEANGRDQARIDTLVALGRRTVFVVTWGEGAPLRTLTNAGGETALPLFTGADVMRLAASRFGWVSPDGGISSKEIGAREAMRHALDHGVGFLVVDLSSSHATEFTRAEIESLLGQQRGSEGVGAYAAVGTASEMIRRAVRESNRPQGGADGFRTSVPPPPRVPSELAGAERPPGRAADRTVAQVPAPQMPERLRRSVTGAPPPPSPSIDGAPVQAMPANLRRSVTGAPPPDVTPTGESAGAPVPPVAAPRVPNATVLQAPVRVGDAARSTGEALPPVRVGDAARSTGEALPAARAPSVANAKAPSVAGTRAPSVSAARAPSVAGARPPPLVTPFGVADQPASERAPSPPGRTRPPTKSPPPDAPADVEVPSSAPPEASVDELHRPVDFLEERVLERMAEALRRYPEVEWACELGDERGESVIGLRIDPSFAGRTAEIGDAVQAAAKENRVKVGVVLLVKPSQVRQARALGRAFFPWRRKRG